MDPQRLIEIALSYVGISGDCPAFQELLGRTQNGARWPLDKPYGKGGISTCAVCCRGWLRILGMLLGPYINESGLNDVIKIAKDAGAWITDGSRPPEGSVVMLQGPKSIHCLVVDHWEGDVCVNVAGGMVNPKTGLQAIKLCRTLVKNGNWEGKRLVGYVDVSRLTA